MKRQHQRVTRMARSVETTLTLDEFVDLIASLVPAVPKEVLGPLLRQNAARLAPYLAPFGRLVWDKREKMVAKGLYVPPRFLSPATAAPSKEYTHEELMAIFRPAWELYQQSRSAGT